MRAKSILSSLTLCDTPELHVAHQAPLSVGFSRQEHWSVTVPSSEGVPDPRIEPRSLLSPALADGFFTTGHLGSPVERSTVYQSEVHRSR